MKKLPIFIFIIWLFSVNVSAQEAKLIDEFGRLPCGDFTSRMSALANEFQKHSNSKIYIVYYGGRFRRKKIWNSETRGYTVTELKFAHRDDGLNLAKAIPLFYKEELEQSREIGKELLGNIVLVNGGYLEDSMVRIWIVLNGSNPPKPIPKLTEKDIEFKAQKPIPIQRYSLCYSEYL